MSMIRSKDYAETEQALANHPLVSAMAYRSPMIKVNGKPTTLVNLTRAELLSPEHDIAREDPVTGEARATHTFMLAAMRQFDGLAELNKDRVKPYAGPMHIGAVSAALLLTWATSRKVVMEYAGLTEEGLDARLTAGEDTSDIINEAVEVRLAKMRKTP
jgi:hypothetical protein